MTEAATYHESANSVVVIDDDPAILRSTSRLLRREGYTVTEAASGAEGVARIHEIRPDLVLMDVNLGDADGRDLCKSLRKKPVMDDTFFVLISNFMTTTDDQVRGLDDGADGYITRPIENRELVARVNAYKRIKSRGAAVADTLHENEAQTGKLELFHKLAVGRELRMMELKGEINALHHRLNEPQPYGNDEDTV